MSTITIQKTSKKLKAHLIICWMMFFIGIFLCAFEGSLCMCGAVLVSIAVLWYIVTRFRIWWNHG